jgi:hypothetical protein
MFLYQKGVRSQRCSHQVALSAVHWQVAPLHQPLSPTTSSVVPGVSSSPRTLFLERHFWGAVRTSTLATVPPPITTTTIPSPLPNKNPATKSGICQCVFIRAYSKKWLLHSRLNLSLCYRWVSKQTLSVSFRLQLNSNGLADGGGVRGVMSLVILRKILREVKRQAPPTPDDETNIEVAIFDLVIGTSTEG